MSDDSRATPDISRVISVIMENPDILEKISALIKNDTAEQSPKSAISDAKDTAVPTYTEISEGAPRHSRRQQLLGALKPYVRRERAQAIDSVIAIADILDMMRGK